MQGASEKDKSDTWENRKTQMITHMKTAPMEILYVVCADKIHNLSQTREDCKKMGEATWNRFNRGKEKQKWYHQSLAAVLMNRRKGEPSTSLFSKYQALVREVFEHRCY